MRGSTGYVPPVDAPSNWDDLRFVLALARAGALLRAARRLGVDHTTVSRRVDAVERALGVRLFARTPTGYVPTPEAEALLPELDRMEQAALAVERAAIAQRDVDAPTGVVRVTSGETFGATWLAPRLARIARDHAGLSVELVTGGEILDLGRREADVAVRLFRSKHPDLVVRRVGEMGHALYASRAYLARTPIRRREKRRVLDGHRLLTTTSGPEAAWVERLLGGAKPFFRATLSSALLEVAKEGEGIAVLPRYLGDAEPTLRRIPMPDAPREPIWITVHRDLRSTARVRVVFDGIARSLQEDAARLVGAP